MGDKNAGIADYTALYKYLSVLDENQIYKLHKVVSGRENIATFSTEEIERLEGRLSLQVGGKLIPMNSN